MKRRDGRGRRLAQAGFAQAHAAELGAGPAR